MEPSFHFPGNTHWAERRGLELTKWLRWEAEQPPIADGTASMLVSPHSLASCKHPQGPCASLLWQMLSEPSYVQGRLYCTQVFHT